MTMSTDETILICGYENGQIELRSTATLVLCHSMMVSAKSGEPTGILYVYVCIHVYVCMYTCICKCICMYMLYVRR